MTGYDAEEGLSPFRDDSGYGAILFDLTRVRLARAHGIHVDTVFQPLAPHDRFDRVGGGHDDV